MNKMDYIKCLRDVQNKYKSELIENRVIFNDELKENLLGINDYRIDKSRFNLVIESYLALIFSNSNYNYISPILLCFAVKNLFCIMKSRSEKNEIIKNYEIIGNFSADYERQSEKIENAIEFLNNTNEFLL